MNVCFLLGGFQGNGGIGRVTSILANALCEKEDLSIHTISYCQKNIPLLYELSDKIQQHALYSYSPPMTKALLFKNAVGKVRSILRKENIDILIASGALYYPLALLAVRGTKTKCYCWEHTDPNTTSDYKFQGWCRRYAVPRADKVLVLTRSAEDYYRQILRISPQKLVQIYNPISNTHVDTSYDVHSKRIIAVGRLTYQKNFDRLIRLAEQILPKYPEWSIDIFGEGEDRQTLAEQITTTGLTGRINLMGQVSNLYDRYPSYAFQWMTSRYEGFPMSLLEGASHRLPLISFDIPTGPNEIIEDGQNGFLVDKEDDDRMVACIEQLIENDELRKIMSQNAYRMVQKFSLNDIIEQWCEIL